MLGCDPSAGTREWRVGLKDLSSSLSPGRNSFLDSRGWLASVDILQVSSEKIVDN